MGARARGGGRGRVRGVSWTPPGTSVAGTRLAREHDHDVRADRLVLPFVDLTGARGAVLRFAHYYFAENAKDGGRVLASADGVNFAPITPLGGYPYPSVDGLHGAGYSANAYGWATAAFDLMPVVGALGPRLQIAFEFGSDHSWAYDGWAIDDVKVLER